MAHVDAGHRAGAAQGDNLPDLAEREPQASALLNEGENADDIRRVDTVPGRSSVCWRQDPARFVEPYRLAADSAPLGNLTD
jgi:hypothetical protein